MSEPTIRTLWGIAKSSELSLTDEELHMLVEAHTGKSSIKKLNKREISRCVRILQDMKTSAGGRRKSYRTGGNAATANQRKKIYKLAEELGWDKPARVNGMCKRMFGTSSVEWLNYQQCSKLIEALKSMVERQEKEAAEAQNKGNGGAKSE